MTRLLRLLVGVLHDDTDPYPTLRWLAVSYAGRDGYLEGWRPE